VESAKVGAFPDNVLGMEGHLRFRSCGELGRKKGQRGRLVGQERGIMRDGAMKGEPKRA
jgi:hypothetical protein